MVGGLGVGVSRMEGSFWHRHRGLKWILGLLLALFVVLGVVVALLAMLPMGGAAFVWVPAVGWLMYQGRWGFAIFMLVWGLMTSGLESVLRPVLISGRARISALAIFVGVLGGIPAFGAIGIIVGPVVLSLVLALIEFAEESGSESGRPKPR